MPGWFAQVLDGGVRPGSVVAVSDLLALRLDTRLHEAGSIELHLPRASTTVREFREGRHLRLYRGTVLRSGGIIEKRIWTPASVQVIAKTQEELLARLVLPPDLPPLSEGSDSPSFITGYHRPAHLLLELCLRRWDPYTWLKERWSLGTITGATVDAQGDLQANGGATTVTFETPEIDLGEDGYKLDNIILEYTSGASGISSTLGQYKTSNTPGGGTYTSPSTSQEETTTGSGGSPIGRVRAWFPQNGSIALNRYARFKVSVTSANSGALNFRFLGVAVRGPQLITKGATWATSTFEVAFSEANRNRLEGEFKRWGDKNLLEILRELVLPAGIEWEARPVAASPPVELHTYATPSVLQSRLPTTGADDAAVGTVAWSNPGNVVASDDTYATATSAAGSLVQTHFLKATTFGFAIPTGSTIRGIVVKVERKAGAQTIGRFARDYRVRIVKGGVIGSTDRAKADKWPTADADATYGTSGDLWGETWAPADINGSGFGAAIAAELSPATVSLTASIDRIQIDVWYGAAGGRGADKRASVVLVLGEQARAEWVQATAENLRTLAFLRSRVMPSDHYQAGGENYIHTSYVVEDRAARNQYGDLHETKQAQELDADNTALTDERRADLAASRDPGTDLECEIVQPTAAITGLALGDIVSLVVPEHGVMMPVRVHGIGVETDPERGEAWSLRLATPLRTPFDPAAADPGLDQIRWWRPVGSGDAHQIEHYVRAYTSRPLPTTKPGEGA